MNLHHLRAQLAQLQQSMPAPPAPPETDDDLPADPIERRALYSLHKDILRSNGPLYAALVSAIETRSGQLWDARVVMARKFFEEARASAIDIKAELMAATTAVRP